MKIESNNIDPKSKSGSIKLIPNNSDDIYYLNGIILPGDKVSSYTTRKISLDGGKTQQKKTLKLEIKVESLESDLDTGIMYIKGKISSENEFVRVGSYHTIDITIGNEFVINKALWNNSDIAKIKERCKEVPEIGFVIFFDKDCVISTISRNEIKVIYKEEIKGKNFKNIILNLLKIKEKIKNIVIGSTSEIRNEFYKALTKEDPSITKLCTVTKLSSDHKGLSNSKTVSKILTDRSVLTSLQNLKFVDDLREIQNFFNCVDQNIDEVCIGLKEVGEAMEYGAIKTLFVTDKFCRPKTVAEREFSDSFIKRAEGLRAKICIIPVGLDSGLRLESMGSVGCTISFKFKN